MAYSKPAPRIWFEYPVMIVRSPKGSGKTEYMAKRVPHLLRLGARVLVMTYRRSLSAALASRLGITNYLRDDGRTYNWPADGYVVCIDSLTRIDPMQHRYDVVIIDECQSVVRHLLSATMVDNRRQVLDLAKHFLQRAQHVVLMDADVGRLTLNFCAEVFRDSARDTLVVDNQWKSPERMVHVYEDRHSPRQAVGDIIAALQDGDRCYVACNSRRDAELLAVEVPKHVRGRTIRVMCITARNSQEAAVLNFIRNIATEILNYDAIFVSPAVSSGVDITFPEDAPEIGAVFGLFHPLVTTHFEIDQQLGRVRNPGRVNVWISADEFVFETDPGVIQAEIWAAEEEHHIRTGYGYDGAPKYLPDPLYDAIYVTATAEERASKNRLRENFIEYKERAGWNVINVPYDAAMAAVGGRVLKEGLEAAEREWVTGLLTAAVLNEGEYGDLRARSKKMHDLGVDDEFAMRRYEIEAFFGTELTEELIAFDDHGKGRRVVQNMEALLANSVDIQRLERAEAKMHAADRFQWGRRKTLLEALLGAAGLFVNGQFDRAAIVDHSSLGAFVIALDGQDIRAGMQGVLKLAPRKDLKRMPARQLSEVLKLVGLKSVRAGRNRAGGTDNFTYKLDTDRLDVVMAHVERRRQRRLRNQAELAAGLS